MYMCIFLKLVIIINCGKVHSICSKMIFFIVLFTQKCGESGVVGRSVM